jgi:hypothetical protein
MPKVEMALPKRLGVRQISPETFSGMRGRSGTALWSLPLPALCPGVLR